MNTYARLIDEAHEVLQTLLQMLVVEPDMKRFKNIAAVYIVWQHELHQLQLASMK